VLRTLETLYRLPLLGHAATASVIHSGWNRMPGMAADLIFTGGRIYTVLPDERRMVPATAHGEAASSEDNSDGAGIGTADGPPATAVAVRRGRIVAVGSDDEIRDLAGGR